MNELTTLITLLFIVFGYYVLSYCEKKWRHKEYKIEFSLTQIQYFFLKILTAFFVTLGFCMVFLAISSLIVKNSSATSKIGGTIGIFVCYAIVSKFFSYSRRFHNFPNYKIKKDLSQAFRCLRVNDGDTLVALSSIGEFKVRLIGIDCPEVNPKNEITIEHRRHLERQAQEFNIPVENLGYLAEKSRNFLSRLVREKEIFLEFDFVDTDKFGRKLAYVYIFDPVGMWVKNNKRYTQINLAMIMDGWAFPYQFEDNKQYADLISVHYRTAREEKKGIFRLIEEAKAIFPSVKI